MPAPTTLVPLPLALPTLLGLSAAAALFIAAVPASGGGADREAASFAPCSGPHRFTCVVDGDTLWYRGQKIRIADINAPEVSNPGCAGEAQLGRRATARLTGLLNAGAFSLRPVAGPNRDRFGRLLRHVTRGGRSLGATLIAEGLAEPWQGRRGDWCAGNRAILAGGR